IAFQETVEISNFLVRQRRVVKLHQNFSNATGVGISREALERRELYDETAQHAAFDNAADAPVVIQQLHGITHVQFVLPRIILVDDQIVGLLWPAAVDKAKPRA